MDLGIINIIDIVSGGCWLSHAIYDILSSWHYYIILACNVTSRTMIIVVPPGAVNTGTINNMLFPPAYGHDCHYRALSLLDGLHGWVLDPLELYIRLPSYVLGGCL